MLVISLRGRGLALPQSSTLPREEGAGGPSEFNSARDESRPRYTPRKTGYLRLTECVERCLKPWWGWPESGHGLMLATSLGLAEARSAKLQGIWGEAEGRKLGAPKGDGLGFPRGTLPFWLWDRAREVRPVDRREWALPSTACAGLKSGGAAPRGRDAGGRAGSVSYSLRDR